MSTAPGERVPRRLRLSRRRAVVSGLALAALAGLAVLAWVWRHPTAFQEPGGWVAGNTGLAPGRHVYFGMTYEGDDAHGTVTIDSAHANVVRDSAGSTIEFLVCTLDTDVGVGAIGSAGDDDIHHYCSSLVPANGARMQLNATPRQQILVAVSLSRPGRVRIEGMDLEYSLGWQHGTQRTGGDIVVVGRSR